MTTDNCTASRFNHGGPCRVCKNEKFTNRYRTDFGFRLSESKRHLGQYAKLSPEQKRIRCDINFKSKYGVSVENFAERLVQQNNLCAVCRIELTLSVDRKSSVRACQDHDHSTKKLRDILCNGCNLMLGYAKDSVEILKRAIAYLEKHADDSPNKIISSDVG